MSEKFRFKPEYFIREVKNQETEHLTASIASEIAQYLLDEYLKTLPRVYGNRVEWLENRVLEEDTHTALLFNVEEIKK